MRRPANQLPQGFTPYLRARDLVAWLNVSRSTVYLWIAQGRIPPGIRLGGVTLYDPRAVSEALGLDLEAR
jgi:predicted DNA-binding transcriptional regulator AlpA